MKLYEIKSENLMIIELSKIDIEFDTEYDVIINTHKFMSEQNIGPAHHRILLNNIDNFEMAIDKFLNIGFIPDRDINNIRLKVRKYLKNLEIIKKQIP